MLRISYLTILLCFWNPPPADAQENEQEFEKLIGKLATIGEEGTGYSTSFSGSQFLPLGGTSQWHSGLLGKKPPRESDTLRKLVEKGIAIVPLLLKHLGDKRKTWLTPVRGMMWMSYSDEYDYNRRTRKDRPRGVNRDAMNEKHPDKHTITVGDLCFVALGQIVNRSWSASRYQPTGGLIVNSPSYSKTLRQTVQAEWGKLSKAQHKASLISDFLSPDHEGRRIGAYLRLAYYYPDAVEALVLPQLRRPAYDVFRVERFLRRILYRTKGALKRRDCFDAFLKKHGKAYRDGILFYLFGDLRTLEADEAGRLSPPLTRFGKEPRELLILLYGKNLNVKSDEHPYEDTWSISEKARFIKTLIHDDSKKIDKAVGKILRGIEDNDDLALGCIERLLPRPEYENDIKKYCLRRMNKSKYYQKALRKVLDYLTK